MRKIWLIERVIWWERSQGNNGVTTEAWMSFMSSHDTCEDQSPKKLIVIPRPRRGSSTAPLFSAIGTAFPIMRKLALMMQEPGGEGLLSQTPDQVSAGSELGTAHPKIVPYLVPLLGFHFSFPFVLAPLDVISPTSSSYCFMVDCGSYGANKGIRPIYSPGSDTINSPGSDTRNIFPCLKHAE